MGVLLPSAAAVQLHALPAGIGRSLHVQCWHRQEEAWRHSLRRCHLVFVPTPRRPSHSQIYTQLEPGQFHALGIKTQRRLIMPPRGHAAVCEQEPKKCV